MRTVHLERPGPGHLLTPLCGAWGSMETDWTEEPDGTTCEACRAAFRAGTGASAGVRERPRALGRGW